VALVGLGNETGLPVDEESEVARLYALWTNAAHSVDLLNKDNFANSDLFSELHELYIRAGWPSLRELSNLSRLSKSTLHEILSGRRATTPKWDAIRLIVEALKSVEPHEGTVRDLDTDLARFYSLWQREQVVAHPKGAQIITAQPAGLVLDTSLGERAVRALADIKRLNGLSDVEAMNRAVLIAQFIDKSLADGFELFMQKPGEESQRIVIP
jgi:lambda repressor-like predicted transcriptional regulator